MKHLSLLMLLTLSACSNPQIQYVTRIERVVITPEDVQYPRCGQPEADRLTPGGSVELNTALRGEIRKCNEMSKHLREWIENEKTR